MPQPPRPLFGIADLHHSPDGAAQLIVNESVKENLMSQPSPTVAKVSVAAKLFQKAAAVAVWAKSPTGRKDLGALVAAATAVYTALHRLGV